MPKFSLNRKITSYTKIQKAIANVIRNKPLFFNWKRISTIDYLDIGCGPNSNKAFINLDFNWNPNIDICWDLSKKKRLPFPDNKFKGIYSEHCFEHITFDEFKWNMKEIHRILQTHGIFRLIMPDGELYLDIYNKRKAGSLQKMPYENGYITGMHRINGIFRNHGHKFIYDFQTVSMILKKVGFRNIYKEKYGIGKDKKLIRDTESRVIESLYVEGIK